MNLFLYSAVWFYSYLLLVFYMYIGYITHIDELIAPFSVGNKSEVFMQAVKICRQIVPRMDKKIYSLDNK